MTPASRSRAVVTPSIACMRWPAMECTWLCRSTKPGPTTSPVTSTTAAPGGASRPGPTAVILPSVISTSDGPSKPTPGSITRPPRSSVCMPSTLNVRLLRGTHDGRQRLSEVIAGGLGQRPQEDLLRRRRRHAGLPGDVVPVLGQLDHVAAAVVGVRVAGHQALALQRVQQRDHGGAVDAQPPRRLLLRAWLASHEDVQ